MERGYGEPNYNVANMMRQINSNGKWVSVNDRYIMGDSQHEFMKNSSWANLISFLEC